MTLNANCKINIGLHVVRKRADGYHDLETVFYPVYGLHDILEVDAVAQDNGISLATNNIQIDCPPEDNLIVRCYRLMKAMHPQIGAVSVKLTKNIPFGAGLGGGSSDAAHTAIALNTLFHLGLDKAALAAEVRALGADCPFFIYNTPCFAEGIGDLLTPIRLRLDGMRLVMVKPPVSVSTREAYAGVHPDEKPGHYAPDHSDYRTYTNDFEKSVFAAHPVLADIKQRLLDAGACYAAMSGSGSTVFGLFEHNTEHRADSRRGLADEDLAPMITFDDTL